MLQGVNQKGLLMYANYISYFYTFIPIILSPQTALSRVPVKYKMIIFIVLFSSALYRYSNVDMRSQEAYELAVQGLLGPDGKSEPILTGLRCIHFQPPNFTLGE